METERVLVASDYYNAHYLNGRLVRQGKPDYLSVETLAREYPDAQVYWVDDDLYDKVVSGEGYPQQLTDFPLTDAERSR